MSLSAAEFARKWSGSERTERAAAQEHFIDLCRLIGVPTPNEADPVGANYAFEKGAEKTLGGGGFADVWRRGYFAWEYKGKNKDLREAYGQLLQYREALDNPPLLVVSDMESFQVHTNFTNTPTNVYTFQLDDLVTHPDEPLRVLRAVLEDPEELRPGTTRDELTAEAAEKFAALAESLRGRGHEPHDVAHFLNRLLFCMFAEDAGLLPQGLMERLTVAARDDADSFAIALTELFARMSHEGGLFGAERIAWFNGGLFDGSNTLLLRRDEIRVVSEVAHLDWSQVEPAVFGVLFERGLDPSKRTQLGAHYTDRYSIARLIEPVLMAPLRADFEAMKDAATALLEEGKRVTARTPRSKNPRLVFDDFLRSLRSIRVLDPACGSGNFLYVALRSLKDLEREALLWASLTFQIPIQFPQIGPEAVLGIEVNPYAAELTRVVIWIGEIQWMLQNGFAYARDPILRPLENIQCRDAILEHDGAGVPTEPEWPTADAIIGNPPFLGGKFLRTNLGDEYVEQLFDVYNARVPREADLVCYWHEKAREMVEAKRAKRVGLLATQGVRGGANRRVLERIKDTGDIFFAWADEPWVIDGASVHVSFLGYDDGSEAVRELNGERVASINANLTVGVDLTLARPLPENVGISFMGDTKGGSFDISSETAAALLASVNPDGRSNSDVIRPWVNGMDITRRPRHRWIIDFGVDTDITEAALYEEPFEYVRAHVKAIRATNRRASYAGRWWLHVEPRPAMRAALKGLDRFIGTPRVSKHRIFVWLSKETLPDSQVIVFARDDDYFFGVLHSRPHELWARALGTQLREAESGFRYTPTTTFETFPFPRPTVASRRAIADAAKTLDELRAGWLHADELDGHGRTLTNLYNASPTWLRQAHERLDQAVHVAYGWPFPLDDGQILARLYDLNRDRELRPPRGSVPDGAALVEHLTRRIPRAH